VAFLVILYYTVLNDTLKVNCMAKRKLVEAIVAYLSALFQNLFVKSGEH